MDEINVEVVLGQYEFDASYVEPNVGQFKVDACQVRLMQAMLRLLQVSLRLKQDMLNQVWLEKVRLDPKKASKKIQKPIVKQRKRQVKD